MDRISAIWRELYEEGGSGLIRELLILDKSQANQMRYGTSLLHIAAAAGDEADIQLLLEQGADVNVRDEIGQTPLHKAATARNPAMCLRLLEHGAIPNVQDKHGRSPTDCAEFGDPWEGRDGLEQTTEVLRRYIPPGAGGH
jgi:hypothetical protein